MPNCENYLVWLHLVSHFHGTIYYDLSHSPPGEQIRQYPTHYMYLIIFRCS